MIKKPNIAVISGGDSSEYIVSVRSGKNVFNAVDNSKFTPWLIQMRGKEWIVIQNDIKIANIDKADFSFTLNGEKINFDFAYITIHGTPGEDGILQGYFELLKIPYSTCGVHSSSLTFNKWFCSSYLRNFGIKMARSIKISRGEKINSAEIVEKLGLPVFVKPSACGSSFGITKVKTETEIDDALKNAWKESNDAIIEEFIEGTEFTCGLVKLKRYFLKMSSSIMKQNTLTVQLKKLRLHAFLKTFLTNANNSVRKSTTFAVVRAFAVLIISCTITNFISSK